MLKKRALRRIIISTLALFVLLLIYVFPKSDELDIPNEIIFTNEITIPIYTVDQNNLVARTNIIKKENDDITYIINVLTKKSNYSNYLMTNFLPIIPENTKLINYSLNDKVLKLNFSKELLNVNENDEEKMIESLVYSLCNLKDVDKIIIFVENQKLNELPHSKKKLPASLDKNYGINKVYDINTFKSVTKATIYFMSEYENNYYYVPITKITNDSQNAVEIIINELKSTPTYENNLISFLNASYTLKNYELLENEIKLSFDNNMLLSLKNNDLLEKVKYSIELSLKDTFNVENVVINFN